MAHFLHPLHTLRNMLTALLFVTLVTLPMLLHLLQDRPQDSSTENRRLAEAPTLVALRDDWNGFPEKINAWMRDHFGLRRSYLKLGFELDKVLRSTADLKAVRGDDGWLFNTLNGALALHQGLLPFAANEADDWLDGLQEVQAAAEASGAVFVAIITPNKHTIYPEHLSAYPRKVAGESRLDEAHRRARARGLPLVDLRAPLETAKEGEQVYYQTDSHWTDLGAWHGFRQVRAALTAQGVTLPDIPREALISTIDPDFQGDLYRLVGVEDGTPERATLLTVDQDRLDRKGGSILYYGDSFAGQFLKYLEATFTTVTFVDNNAGEPDLTMINAGDYDVVLFQIVERYLSRPLAPKSR